jgi:streptomycin 6-kinase
MDSKAAWLERLPATICELERRWSLRIGARYEQATCAWVAPAEIADGTPAVLKLAMPHMEGLHELQGLQFWNRNPTVQVLASDEALRAMLLERCEPGTPLSQLLEPEQDVILAWLLRRLRRTPAEPHCFRALSVMTEYWRAETLLSQAQWPDAVLVREGLDLFNELNRTATTHVLLATDLHAGNILRAEREPWLVIDPKPFIGDPAYDATQHLFNCLVRLNADPLETIRRVAGLLEVDPERVQLWMFARASAEPRDNWGKPNELAISLAP